MIIEILYFEGCPNREPAIDLAREVVSELGLVVEIQEVEILTAKDAERLRFLGSPSIRVNGADIEPEASEWKEYALSCRMYNGQGLPPRELLLDALRDGSDS